MLYEIVTTAIAGIAAYYGWRQYLLAKTLTKQSKDRPHSLDQPQMLATDKTTPLGYVELGEFIWYLWYPPYTTPTNMFKAIDNFLKHLDACGLSDTRATAKPLESIKLLYNDKTGLITPESLLTLVNVMEVVKSSLENELRKRDK